jgi:hypothetical protein
LKEFFAACDNGLCVYELYVSDSKAADSVTPGNITRSSGDRSIKIIPKWTAMGYIFREGA